MKECCYNCFNWLINISQAKPQGECMHKKYPNLYTDWDDVCSHYSYQKDKPIKVDFKQYGINIDI